MAVPDRFTLGTGLKFLWPYLNKYKWNYLFNYLFTFLNSVLNSFTPIVLGLLIDEVVYYRNFGFFLKIAGIYVFIYVISVFVQISITLIGRYLMAMLSFDIRLVLFKRVMTAKASYLANIKSGNIISILDVDMNSCNNVITNVLAIVNAGFQLLLYTSFLMIYNWKFGIMLGIALPIFYLISKNYGTTMISQGHAARRAKADYISWLFEFLRGLREIKLLAAEKVSATYLVRHYKEMIGISAGASKTSLSASYINAFIKLLVNLGTYIMAGYLAYRGEITIGAFVAIMSYFASASGNVDSMIRVYYELQGRMSSLRRVAQTAELDTEEEEWRTDTLEAPEGEIEFKNVSFSYDDRNSVLEDVTLKIGSGEHIAIVGASGAGKSTITALLLGFYTPERGSIEIDGMDLSTCTLKSIREKIGVVQQEVLIFEGTIRMNLSLGNLHATEDEMMEACDKAAIGDFIRSLPDGLDTIIGREGMDFSGGQKQRLSIARIYLKNPKILIFDEATSALDYEAEKLVHGAWEGLTKGRTTITIAHRLSTILGSDRVAVLSEGRIDAVDHHLRLLSISRVYRDLFEDQYTKGAEADV